MFDAIKFDRDIEDGMAVADIAEKYKVTEKTVLGVIKGRADKKEYNRYRTTKNYCRLRIEDFLAEIFERSPKTVLRFGVEPDDLERLTDHVEKYYNKKTRIYSSRALWSLEDKMKFLKDYENTDLSYYDLLERWPTMASRNVLQVRASQISKELGVKLQHRKSSRLFWTKDTIAEFLNDWEVSGGDYVFLMDKYQLSAQTVSNYKCNFLAGRTPRGSASDSNEAAS